MTSSPYSPTHGGVVPGWYRDPFGSPMERWWDGVAWGQATRGLTPMYMAIPMAPPVTNGPATAGLTLGIIAMFVNTFLVVSILAFVFSIVGLTKAGELRRQGFGPIGQARCVWGLVLATLGAIGTALFKLFLF